MCARAISGQAFEYLHCRPNKFGAVEFSCKTTFTLVMHSRIKRVSKELPLQAKLTNSPILPMMLKSL